MTFLLCHSGGLIVNGTEPWKGLWFGSQALGVPSNYSCYIRDPKIIFEVQKASCLCNKGVNEMTEIE